MCFNTWITNMKCRVQLYNNAIQEHECSTLEETVLQDTKSLLSHRSSWRHTNETRKLTYEQRTKEIHHQKKQEPFLQGLISEKPISSKIFTKKTRHSLNYSFLVKSLARCLFSRQWFGPTDTPTSASSTLLDCWRRKRHFSGRLVLWYRGLNESSPFFEVGWSG